MGLLDRMGTIVKSKMSRIMDRMEDPREVLDYSYEKQLELLQNVKRGIAEVATSKKRLELQRARLAQSAEQLEVKAREALSSGREDLARQALERKVSLQNQIEILDAQIAELDREEQKLIAVETRLSTKIETLRAKKEAIKAQYSAAEAQVKVTESVTGISEELADVGLAIQRAEEKTEGMKARAAALDDLLEKGVLEDYTGGDALERELSKVKTSSAVEAELAKLRGEMK